MLKEGAKKRRAGAISRPKEYSIKSSLVDDDDDDDILNKRGANRSGGGIGGTTSKASDIQ